MSLVYYEGIYREQLNEKLMAYKFEDKYDVIDGVLYSTATGKVSEPDDVILTLQALYAEVARLETKSSMHQEALLIKLEKFNKENT
jgi:hypothetical protein